MATSSYIADYDFRMYEADDGMLRPRLIARLPFEDWLKTYYPGEC